MKSKQGLNLAIKQIDCMVSALKNVNLEKICIREQYEQKLCM
jgi:hypothetical protein